MNSRERVEAAIARRPVDRVPLGFYAVDHDTVSRVLGRPTFVRNKVEVQVALWEGRRAEVAEGLKKDTVEFYRKIDCADILLPKEAQLLPPADYEPLAPEKIAPDTWRDRRGRVYRANRAANEIACVHDPGRETEGAPARGAPAEPEPPDPSVFEVLDHVIGELGRERYIACYSGGTTALSRPGGTEHGLLLHALDPDAILEVNRRSVRAQNLLDRHYLRPGAAGVLMDQDMGSTKAPLVSPEMFRRLCFPFLRERVARVKEIAGRVILHNCGNNIPLMEMFIEAGIDCYQSLQTNAGMEVGRLKEMFGGRMSFWGGVPVETLIAGTPGEVRGAVRTALERGAPGGGFILGPSHSVAMNTRYGNFMALLDEFVKLRDRY